MKKYGCFLFVFLVLHAYGSDGWGEIDKDTQRFLTEFKESVKNRPMSPQQVDIPKNKADLQNKSDDLQKQKTLEEKEKVLEKQRETERLEVEAYEKKRAEKLAKELQEEQARLAQEKAQKEVDEERSIILPKEVSFPKETQEMQLRQTVQGKKVDEAYQKAIEEVD